MLSGFKIQIMFCCVTKVLDLEVFVYLKRNFICYNLVDNICELFYVLMQFPFTAIEMGLDYYHHKINIGVASRVAKRL